MLDDEVFDEFRVIVMESDGKFEIETLHQLTVLAWYQIIMNQECWNRL